MVQQIKDKWSSYVKEPIDNFSVVAGCYVDVAFEVVFGH